MTAKARPTLAHVAKQANVSITTASAALRNSGRVNEETRARVRAAAAAIDYRKDAGAMALRSGRSSLVGVVLESTAFDDNPRNPKLFWPRFLNGLAQELTQAGLGIALVSRSNPKPLVALPIDALLMLADLAEELPFEVPYGIPIISGSRHSAGTNTWAGHDYAAIARTCTDHLVEQGARSVVLVSSHGPSPTDHLTFDALGEELRRAKLPFRTVTESDNALAEALTNGADTIVTLGDDVDEILSSIRGCGLSTPADVLLFAFSEGDREARTDPPITTLSFLGRDSGRTLGRMIASGLADGRFQSCTLPFRFEQRTSTTRST